MAVAPLRMVLCTWEDASVLDDGPWVDREGAPPPKARVFHQLGWLVSMDADCVVLSHAADDQQMAARERIPMGMVKQLLEFDPAIGEPVRLPRRRKAK